MSKLLEPGLMTDKLEWGMVCTDTNKKRFQRREGKEK
jgi:hypothetical protein